MLFGDAKEVVGELVKQPAGEAGARARRLPVRHLGSLWTDVGVDVHRPWWTGRLFPVFSPANVVRALRRSPRRQPSRRM